MNNLKPFIQSLLKLSLPIYLGQIGNILIAFGDVFIAAQHSNESVAGIGLALSLSNPLMFFGVGFTLGISAFMAIKLGKTNGIVKGQLLDIVCYSLGVGIVVAGLTLILNPLIALLNFEEELIPLIMDYNFIIAFSFPFVVLFSGLKEYEQAFERVYQANLIQVLSVVFNFALNWALVFGLKIGKVEYISPMGAIGVAWGSLIIRVFGALIFLWVVWIRERFGSFDMSFFKNIFKFSLPIAVMFLLEVLAFCFVGVLSGFMGTTESAVNNIIINIGTLVIVAPLALGGAVTVKIGNAFGENNLVNVKNYFYGSLFIIFIYFFPIGLLFIFAGDLVMSGMTNDLNLINLGSQVLLIWGFFQVFDNTQIVFAGVLRGLGEVKLPFIGICIAFWVLGLPLGIYLGFYKEMGLEGLWWGLALGLVFVCGFFLFIIIYKFNHLTSYIPGKSASKLI